MHAVLQAVPCPPGPVRRLPAGVKISFALLLIVVTVSLPARWAVGLAGVAGVLAVVVVVSRVSIRHFLARLLLLEPLVVGVAALSFLQPDGWRIGLLLMARCTICLATMILLSATTEISEMVRVMRTLRLPGLLITTMLLMHRYVFVLIDESQRMGRARASRTFVPRRRFAWRNVSSVIGQLFIRAVGRADRVYAAMCARGWR